LKENTRTLNKKFLSGEKLSWLTCYDYSFAKIIDSTDIDMILVGDSGGMVTLGYKDTSPVTMDEMIMLSSAVRRGAPNKFIVGDMPKGSYEVSDEEAVRNAMRFIKESGCDAVKLEGFNEKILSRVKSIADSGIVVIGHIGLTPQSLAQQGGYRVVGRDKKEILSQYGVIYSPSPLWAEKAGGKFFKWPQDTVSQIQSYEDWIPRKNKAVMVQGNKWSAQKGEMYSLRRKIISQLSNDLDLYGVGWNRGIQPDLYHLVSSMINSSPNEI
jgi:hypothetical protein